MGKEHFLVTTTIQPREQDLRTTIPIPGQRIPLALPPMLIELRRDGEVLVNPGEVAEAYDSDVGSRELPELRNRLRMVSMLGKRGQPNVLLRVHDEALQQRYIDVINCLASAGIDAIAIVD